MRRLLAVVLVPVLLLMMASPVLGASHRETALAYLQERYGVTAEQIELYEGGIVELEFTGVSMWMGRYIIGGGAGGGSSPSQEPGSEPNTRLPATDTPKPQLMPMPEGTRPAPDKGDGAGGGTGDGDKGGFSYGAVYISTATGRVLEPVEAERLFAAEQDLAAQEWERLRGEAGKLDVSLYRRLLGAAKGEKLSVWIQPMPTISEELRAEFAALRAKYPRVAAVIDVELEELLFPQSASILPMTWATDLGNTASDAPVSSHGGATEPAHGGVIKPGGTEPAITIGRIEPDVIRPGVDDEYWQESVAFWAGVEQIRLKAVEPAIESLKAAMDQMGLAYQEQRQGYALVADLTAAQINAVAELECVMAIFEDAIFTTMDAMMGPGGARLGTEQTMLTPAPGSELGRSATAAAAAVAAATKVAPVLFGAALLCGGAVVVAQRRRR